MKEIDNRTYCHSCKKYLPCRCSVTLDSPECEICSSPLHLAEYTTFCSNPNCPTNKLKAFKCKNEIEIIWEFSSEIKICLNREGDGWHLDYYPVEFSFLKPLIARLGFILKKKHIVDISKAKYTTFHIAEELIDKTLKSLGTEPADPDKYLRDILDVLLDFDYSEVFGKSHKHLDEVRYISQASLFSQTLLDNGIYYSFNIHDKRTRAIIIESFLQTAWNFKPGDSYRFLVLSFLLFDIFGVNNIDHLGEHIVAKIINNKLFKLDKQEGRYNYLSID